MTSQIGRLSPRQGLTAAALLLAIAGCSCADRAGLDESAARDSGHGGSSSRRSGMTLRASTLMSARAPALWRCSRI